MKKKDPFAPDATKLVEEADGLDDPRLAPAIQEYLRLMETGQTPTRQEFLRRYPDVAGPLAKCLDGLELVHKAAARSRAGAPMPSAGDVLPANPLGDFQIIREIGRGGMGVVYEATQLSLGRRVALKVLPFAATFDAKHLQRFQNEAHAAAQLHHTNIVPVYFVGCERGVHFYAMQLIEGQTLAEVLRQIRGKESGVRSQESGIRSQGSGVRGQSNGGQDLAGVVETSAVETLSPLTMALSTQRTGHRRDYYHAAARLMVQAAEALEHAHQYGIVHRDVKPANLLVDAHGRLWVTDFGLAQFNSDVGLTKTGDVIGTLRYMSPEQASGQRVLLDHRTDVYSLGATLYEIATTKPIFPGQNPQELLRQILHDEPKSPRAIDASIPIELETIILKAISKNAADRYGTARELSADLQRFLADEPIQAKRPSMPERVRKWSRRHPSFVRAAVVLLVCGVIGFAVSTALIAREQGRTKTALDSIKDEQGKTKAALDRELKRTEEAEERFRLARRSADEIIQIAQEESFDNPALQQVRRRLLETALVYYQEFIELRGKDSGAQTELAATRDRVKKILADLAELQGAGRHNLLRSKSVQENLKMTPEQRDALNDFWHDQDRALPQLFVGFSKLSSEERTARVLEMARSTEAAIADILKPAQQPRLSQIALQCRGPMALLESDVATPLKLTAEQKRQIRGLEVGMRFDKPPPPESKGGGPGPPGKFFEDRRKRVMEQAEKILDKEQVKLWHEMIGEVYTGPSPMFLPPGPMFGDFGMPHSKGFGPKKKDGPPRKDKSQE
jgi:serine/threonine protein kinase